MKLKLKLFLKKQYKKFICFLSCIVLIFSFCTFSTSAVSVSPYTESLTIHEFYNRTESATFTVYFKNGTSTVKNGHMQYIVADNVPEYYIWAVVPSDFSNPIVGFDIYFSCVRTSETSSDNPYFGFFNGITNFTTEVSFDSNLWNPIKQSYSNIYLDSIDFIGSGFYSDGVPFESINFSNLGTKYVTNGRPGNNINFNESVDLGTRPYGNILDINYSFLIPEGATYRDWTGNADQNQSAIRVSFRKDLKFESYSSLADVPQYEKPNNSTLNDALDLEGSLLDEVGGDLGNLDTMLDATLFEYDDIRNSLLSFKNIYTILFNSNSNFSYVFGLILRFSIALGLSGFVLNIVVSVISKYSAHSRDGTNNPKGGGS